MSGIAAIVDDEKAVRREYTVKAVARHVAPIP
jgi:hypothetical protein